MPSFNPSVLTHMLAAYMSAQEGGTQQGGKSSMLGAALLASPGQDEGTGGSCPSYASKSLQKNASIRLECLENLDTRLLLLSSQLPRGRRCSSVAGDAVVGKCCDTGHMLCPPGAQTQVTRGHLLVTALLRMSQAIKQTHGLNRGCGSDQRDKQVK